MTSHMTELRWGQLMAALGIHSANSMYVRLLDAYSEKHRRYHTVAHIDACLRHLDTAKHLARDPNEIELAIWFHDAVYDPYKSGNEEKSAVWACEFLNEHTVGAERIERIRNLILATKHDAVATDLDAQLLVDIDLSILGASEEAYAAFEKNVREEYKWVPGPIYRKKRAEILQSFLHRSSIYNTDQFRLAFETSARNNLARAIDTLSS